MRFVRLSFAMCSALLAAVVLAIAASCATFGSAEVPDESGAPESSAGDASASGDGIDGAMRLSYAQTVLADEPLGYWRLGEARGRVAVSQTNQGTDNGIIAGNVGFGAMGAIANDPDTAFLITADGQLIQVDDPRFDFVGTAPYTLEAWVKPTQIDGSFRHVFTNDNGGASGVDRDAYNVYLNVTGKATVTFERYVAGAGPKTSASYDIPVDFKDHWHHVVAVYDGSKVALFVDGMERANMPDGRKSTKKMPWLRIGAQASNGPSVLGTLDEVGVYEKALTADQIKAHYKNGIGE